MIGYYVHHQGHGHCSRATAVAGQIGTDVVALTSASLCDPAFSEVITLERDDADPEPSDVDVHGLLHWAPRHDGGLRTRMAQVAEFVAERTPAAVVVDVSVEVTLFLRLLGVPVIVTAQPGVRDDLPHQLAYRAADAIIAPWPAELYQPGWLREHLSKTVFTGGISRFDGRPSVSHPTLPRMCWSSPVPAGNTGCRTRRPLSPTSCRGAPSSDSDRHSIHGSTTHGPSSAAPG